jgi:Transcription elongation factor, N-terminal
MQKGFTRKPKPDEPATPVKNYITRSGLERLNDEHRFLLTRERPAVTQVVAWAASNGDRSDNADYRYGKRRLRQIDGRRGGGGYPFNHLSDSANANNAEPAGIATYCLSSTL